jgi:hypothetical protein
LVQLIVPLWQSKERYRHASRLDDLDLAERNSERQAILDARIVHAEDQAAEALHNHVATTVNLLACDMGGVRVDRRRPNRCSASPFPIPHRRGHAACL